MTHCQLKLTWKAATFTPALILFKEENIEKVNSSRESINIQLQLSNNTDLTRMHFSQIKMYVFPTNLKTGLDFKASEIDKPLTTRMSLLHDMYTA